MFRAAYVGLQSNLTLTCGMSFHQITAALNYPCVVSTLAKRYHLEAV